MRWAGVTAGRRMRRVAGGALGWIIGLWCRTLRVVVEGTLDEGLGRRVFAFLHGQQMVLLGLARGRPLAVLVSRSLDGELQAGVMGAAGFTVVRGSSSRGGVAGLSGMISTLRGGMDTAFAVDGPRGPSGVVRGGALVAARAGAARLIPVAASMGRGVVLTRTWDRFEIPLPFSRVAVVIGSPLDPAEATPQHVSALLAEATGRARVLAERRGAEAP